MSLYLCIFEGDREIEGVEVGSYADFNAFRNFAAGQSVPQAGHANGEATHPAGNANGDTAVDAAEGTALAGFPMLLGHSDCDGSWSPDECVALRRELAALAEALKNTPGAPVFTDVDGEPLIARLRDLVEIAIARSVPILFQ